MNKTKQLKIAAAKDFVSEHYDNDVFCWQVEGSTKDEKYLNVFDIVMRNSDYESDGFGNIMIEISSSESLHNRPVLFCVDEKLMMEVV